MVRAGIWLEVTTLLVPGLNDDQIQLEGLAAFIAGNLGKVTPWHISNIYPNYQYVTLPCKTSMPPSIRHDLPSATKPAEIHLCRQRWCGFAHPLPELRGSVGEFT